MEKNECSCCDGFGVTTLGDICRQCNGTGRRRVPPAAGPAPTGPTPAEDPLATAQVYLEKVVAHAGSEATRVAACSSLLLNATLARIADALERHADNDEKLLAIEEASARATDAALGLSLATLKRQNARAEADVTLVAAATDPDDPFGEDGC